MTWIMLRMSADAAAWEQRMYCKAEREGLETVQGVYWKAESGFDWMRSEALTWHQTELQLAA